MVAFLAGIGRPPGSQQVVSYVLQVCGPASLTVQQSLHAISQCYHLYCASRCLVC